MSETPTTPSSPDDSAASSPDESAAQTPDESAAPTPDESAAPTPDESAAPTPAPETGLAPAPPSYAPAPAAPAGYPAPYGGPGPAGDFRNTGVCILLFIVTLGIYGLYWFYKVHKEMKQHSGEGIGGGIALILAIFVGIVIPYLTSSEVGHLYERRGQQPPVSGITGLWYFPGNFIIVGPLVWFIKTNGALNSYWESVGAEV